MNHELIQRARRYTTEMHERINQRRKYTLADGQEISGADWPAIVRLARLLGAIADSSDSRAISF